MITMNQCHGAAKRSHAIRSPSDSDPRQKFRGPSQRFEKLLHFLGTNIGWRQFISVEKENVWKLYVSSCYKIIKDTFHLQYKRYKMAV